MALLGSPRAYLGLDIGTVSIKLVELLDRGRRHDLATYAHAPLPKSVDLADLIARMLEKAQTSADAIVMSLPNSAIFSTKLTLPEIPEPELAAVIKFRAREVVPAPLEDVELAWYKQPGGVYLIAVAKPAVISCRRLASQLNLKLAGLEAEIFPLLRTHAMSDKQNTLLCNIGGRETTLHIISRGFPYLSRTVDIGTDHLKASDSQFRQLLLLEVKRTVTGQHISKTILIGGGASLAHLKNHLAPLLGHQPTISNPWQSLSYLAGLEDSLAGLGPKFAVAVGLARSRLPAL